MNSAQTTPTYYDSISAWGELGTSGPSVVFVCCKTNGSIIQILCSCQSWDEQNNSTTHYKDRRLIHPHPVIANNIVSIVLLSHG